MNDVFVGTKKECDKFVANLSAEIRLVYKFIIVKREYPYTGY